MKMEKLKIAIDNTSQNSSRTFGEILSADMRGKKVMSLPEAQDTWWFKALHKIKENQVYKYEYVLRHNPSEKFLLADLDTSVIVGEGSNLNNFLLEEQGDTYDVNEVSSYCNELVTLLGTHFLDKERYLKVKSKVRPSARDLVQRAAEHGEEKANDFLFSWLCLSLFIGCYLGKEVDDTTLTFIDQTELSTSEAKELVGNMEDWKNHPIVKEGKLTKKQLIELVKQGTFEKQWS